MLEQAVERLPCTAKPLVHSDCGVHYRWDGWIDLMRRHGLTCSISCKGCSPDNSACKGLFGKLRVGMYFTERAERKERSQSYVKR